MSNNSTVKVLENPLSILDNIEEEDEPLDFSTRMKLHKMWDELAKEGKLITDLEEGFEEEEYVEKEEEPPLIAPFNKLELIAEDTRGKIRKIGAMTKGVIHGEKLKEIKKNPDLKFLCNINNGKVYYNIPKDEWWIEVYAPIWINHKRTMKKVGSIKLEPHDFENMLALAILYFRDFHNPIYPQIWIRKKVRKKMRKIIDKFEGGKTHEESS